MTVEELIKHLQTLPQDAKVTRTNYAWQSDDPIDEDDVDYYEDDHTVNIM